MTSATGTAANSSLNSRQLRVALLPWMVAGVRTQYENLRLVEPPAGTLVDTFPIVPYKEGGLIERVPLLRSSQKGTLRSTVRVLPLLRRPSYDAVWTQTLLPLLPVLLAGNAPWRHRPAIVYTIDTTPALMDSFHTHYYGGPPPSALKRSARDALHRYALARCTAITPWSEWAARSFVHDYGVPEGRIQVIPPGVDLASWSVPQRRFLSHSLARSEPYRLLFVGADFVRKGGDLLLEVYRRHLRPRCELHLVTKAEIVDEPGVHIYRGFSPNDKGLQALYEWCDALVLPTRADCFSMAALEAMACGLPVITCPVGGIPEIVRHNETGLLVSPGDGRALLEAINTLVGDRTRCIAMGRTGRQVVEQRFDNERSSSALFTMLRHLAQQERSRRN